MTRNLTETSEVPTDSNAHEGFAATSTQWFRSSLKNPSDYGVWLGILGSVVPALLLLFTSPAREVQGLYILLIVFGLLLTGVHIGLAMAAAGSLGLYKLVGISGIANIWEQSTFQVVASWTYSVIPMFVLMAMILGNSGLAAKAYASAAAWFGRVPGGLAIATNFSGAGLAAASGSSIAISYSLGRVAIPEMIKAKYHPSLATASVAMAGTLGQIIPPGILLVIYAGVVQVPVGPQLMAGIVPGILLALAYGIYIYIRASLKPEIAPPLERKISFADKVRSTRHLIPILIVVMVVIGGIFTGWLTATEAGAVGAFIALILGLVVSRSRFRSPRDVGVFIGIPIVEMVKTTAGILLLIVGVSVLTRAIALSRIPNTLTNWLVDVDLSIYAFIAVLVAVFFVLGMFLDALAMMLLTVPILAAPVEHMGIDLIWFGIFVIVMAEIGQVSPPIGMLAFIVHRVAQKPDVNLGAKISLASVFKGLLPFIGVSLLVLLLLTVFPELVLWLPNASG